MQRWSHRNSFSDVWRTFLLHANTAAPFPQGKMVVLNRARPQALVFDDISLAVDVALREVKPILH